MNRSSRVYIGLLTGVALFGIGVFVHSWWPFFVVGGDVHMPDAAMSAAFRSHRPALEHLMKMARHDRLVGNEIGGRTDLLSRLSPARQDEYRRTLQRIGAKHGFNRSGDGTVYITLTERGTITMRSFRGYVHSTEPLEPLVASLEADPPPATEAGTKVGVVYRHLDGPWYLFYEWDE